MSNFPPGGPPPPPDASGGWPGQDPTQAMPPQPMDPNAMPPPDPTQAMPPMGPPDPYGGQQGWPQDPYAAQGQPSWEGYGQPPQSGGNNQPLIIGLILLALVVVAGGAFLLLSGDDDDENEDPDTELAGEGEGEESDEESDEPAEESDEPAESAESDEPTEEEIPEVTMPEDLEMPEIPDVTMPELDLDTGSTGSESAGIATAPPSDPEGTAENDTDADNCYTGDMAACDDLYLYTPIGSLYEEYGATCGGRFAERHSNSCETDLGPYAP